MNSPPHEQSLAAPRAVPLGRLLVERGLLTEEQLIEGLLEQDRTGDRLGKVLIDLGFVDAPSVAMALATQHGGPLKTEYGFATGFDPAASPPLSSELGLTNQTEVAAGGSPTHAEAMSAEPAPCENGAESLPAGPNFTVTAELDRPPNQNGAVAEPGVAQEELEAAYIRIADLDRELEAAREQLAERRSKTAELGERLAAAQLAAETAIAALRRVTEAPP
jgi:hypothetical protein